MGSRTWRVLLALALLVPTAAAADASGEFVARGALSLPDGARQDAQARGAYLPAHDQGFQTLTIHARRMHVQRFEDTVVETRVPELRYGNVVNKTVSSYDLTDVVVTLAPGDHRGWVGMYFPQEGGPLALDTWGASSVLAQGATRLGDGVLVGAPNEAETPSPASRSYQWQEARPLLLVSGEGTVAQRGQGTMKLFGPDLLFSAKENETFYPTGMLEQDAGAAGRRIDRWFFLEYEEAEVTVETPEPFQVAALASRASWSGAASFHAVEGQMTSAGSAYAAAGQRVRVVGDLVAALAPLAEGAEAYLRLDLSGDLAETTLARQGRAAAPLGVRPQGWALLVGMAVVAGVAALVTARALRRRARKERAPVGPEDRLALARIEAGRERFHEAVAHVREARAQAPTSVRLILEEASYLGAMGKVEEALAHYAEAAALDPDGDADFQAAVLLLQSGGDAARAEALLVKALARSPILVLEVLYDVAETFVALRGRPDFERAVEDARRALGET